jgi:GNAT superfamily N-acetyltransferase
VTERIGLERRTSDFPKTGLPQGINIGQLPTPEVLAPVMLAAYEGTPDYEGETLEDTISELGAVLQGKYGALITAASFAAYDGEAPVGAIITVIEDGIPLVALVFTLSGNAGMGIASVLLSQSASALNDAGYSALSLAVNLENARAVKLYEHLGFTAAE